MWPPNFKTVQDLQEAADIINRPHEDYPMRVSKTNQLILAVSSLESVIDSLLVKQIHSVVMWDLPDRGAWRKWNVRVGYHIPPDHLEIPRLMEMLLPQTPSTREELERFYIDFETIHPFSDGNGRVGGIVIASFHKQLFDSYLVSGT